MRNDLGRGRGEDLRKRTMDFALDVIRFTEALPRTRTADVLGRQVLRSGTSVGANYRAACRARSNAEFIAKMGIVEEEADESLYWLELLTLAGCTAPETSATLISEADQLLAITVASIRTAKQRGTKAP